MAFFIPIALVNHHPVAMPIQAEDFWGMFHSPEYEKDLFLFQVPQFPVLANPIILELMLHLRIDDTDRRLPHTAKIVVQGTEVKLFEESFRIMDMLIAKNKYPRVFFTAQITNDGEVLFHDERENTSEDLGRRIVTEIHKLCTPMSS